MRRASIYSKFYIKGSHRQSRTPRVLRPMRPRVIAWSGPDAFYPNRFFEIDNWYKARIERPELFPEMYVIDPDQIVNTFEEKFLRRFDQSINIGFKPSKKSPTNDEIDKSDIQPRKEVSIDDIEFNSVSLTNHFNVFEDLFLPKVFFYNTQPIKIEYTDGADVSGKSKTTRVNFGNTLDVSSAISPPKVSLTHSSVNNQNETDKIAYNTILMVNLEGSGIAEEASPNEQANKKNSTNNEAKYKNKFKYLKSPRQDENKVLLEKLEHHQVLHWFLANIPSTSGTDDAGETIVPYLQPIPYYGTGYHRIAFVLFRHKEKIDFSSFRKEGKDDLVGRNFKMIDFYKKFEDVITPSALRFCLCKWDQSCDLALKRFGLGSPRFWYEWNEDLRPQQKEFPLKPMPFDQYLDMYRNPKTVRKDIERKRLEMLINLPPGEKLQPQKYPDIFYQDNVNKISKFAHRDLMQQNTGKGIWSALYKEYQNPALQHEDIK